MNETQMYLTICEEHKSLGKSDWLGSNHIANEHVQTFGCHETIYVVHEKPWNVAVNTLDSDANEQIQKLGQEARIIYQYSL